MKTSLRWEPRSYGHHDSEEPVSELAGACCEENQERGRGDAQRGYTYQYNRRGRNVTVVAKKLSDLRGEAPESAHTTLSFSIIKERGFQNHKKYENSLSAPVILLRGALSPSPRRGLSGGGGAPIDKTTGRCPSSRPPRSPALSRRGKQHDFHAKVHSFSSKMHHSSPLPHTRVTRHAPSHPHFSRGVFLPSPFTFTPTTLIYKRLRVNITSIFCFTEVKAKGVKPSHLSPYFPTIYAQQVKR